MFFRMMQLNVIAFAMLLVAGQAFTTNAAKEASHKGKVVSITSTELVMTSKGGPEHSVGISANSIVHYEFLLKMDKYLVIVHGTPDGIERAKERLQHSRLIIHSEPVAMVA